MKIVVCLVVRRRRKLKIQLTFYIFDLYQVKIPRGMLEYVVGMAGKVMPLRATMAIQLVMVAAMVVGRRWRCQWCWQRRPMR